MLAVDRHPSTSGTKDVFVRPAKAGAFSRSQTDQGKSQSPVAWMTERRETNALKLIDKATLGVVSELPGRNESERIGDLESFNLGGRAHKDGVKAAWGAEIWLRQRSTPAGR